MVLKKQPPEPANTDVTDCNILIRSIYRTVLKISPHCWDRNEEFRASKKKKVKDNLENYLLDAKIIKDLVRQIREEKVWFEGINYVWPPWKYYGCDGVVDQRNGLNYIVIFFLDDNNTELIGVITVYPNK